MDSGTGRYCDWNGRRPRLSFFLSLRPWLRDLCLANCNFAEGTGHVTMLHPFACMLFISKALLILAKHNRSDRKLNEVCDLINLIHEHLPPMR